MMNTERCREHSALVTPQGASGISTGLTWAPFHPTERTYRGDLGSLVNITMKKGKNGIVSDFRSY